MKRIVAIAIAVLGLATAPGAGAIEPGFDLFETDPQGTQFSFADEFTIPAGFFDQGSAAFQGDVAFTGVPIGTFMGEDVGDADTVVQRPNAINLPTPLPSSATGSTELVQLSLVSMEPIQVTVGDAQQLWDVRVTQSPTRRSTGQIQINQTGDLGGSYSSTLQVFPRFEFTRLADGAVRTLDTGAMPMSEQTAQKLTLRAGEIPWRTRCEPPALDTPALSRGFCPGLTTDPEPVKADNNVEAAALARHKVYPAQPRLEHFGCYGTEAPRPKPLALTLVDQFRTHKARLRTRGALCTPTRKNREPIVNRDTHLQCYSYRTRTFRPRVVAVRNQFGSQQVRVIAPKVLCAPASKSLTRRAPPPLDRDQVIDHFNCYSATSRTQLPATRLVLADQFGRRVVKLGRVVQLCAPAKKGNTPSEHPVQHLVCYTVTRTRFNPVTARVRDQFGVVTLRVVLPGQLCVPSTKRA